MGRRLGPTRSRTASRRISRESTSDFIKANTKTSRDWPTVGLDYAENRGSANSIRSTPDNVKDLGARPGVTILNHHRAGSRQTPVVVDGIMYQSAPLEAWVHAIDARTGKKIWVVSIQVLTGQRAIGVAVTLSAVASPFTKGKVFVAAYDGRLIALDARGPGPRPGKRTRLIGSRAFLHRSPAAPSCLQRQGS